MPSSRMTRRRVAGRSVIIPSTPIAIIARIAGIRAPKGAAAYAITKSAIVALVEGQE